MVAKQQLLLVAALLIGLAAQSQCAAAEGQKQCGTAGAACCCSALDYLNAKCCGAGLECTVFGGRGFGEPPVLQAMCLPKAGAKAEGAAAAAVAPCGAEGGPCCIARGSGGKAAASCGAGLACVPSADTQWASKKMYERLLTNSSSSSSAGGVSALKVATADTATMGRCLRMTRQDCGGAYMPCGADAAALGVACAAPTACPSGFYCAARYDAVVGERCLPLPSDAGKVGGPCMPNNLPAAPLIADPKRAGAKLAAPFCHGGATCFANMLADTAGFTFAQGAKAKALAARVRGTRCMDVPADCGKPGRPCCPSGYGALTDKPLPSDSTSWAGAPCDDAGYGSYCDGNYAWVAAASEGVGTCRANPACGEEGQPCCRYSTPQFAGTRCPALRAGKGYCGLAGTCRVCPVPPARLDIFEDLVRCY